MIQRRLKARSSAHQQIIMEHIAQALQSATDRWLAQKKPGGAGDVSFLCQYREDGEKVEIGLTQLHDTHTQYYYYAWDVSSLECNLGAKTTSVLEAVRKNNVMTVDTDIARERQRFQETFLPRTAPCELNRQT